MKCCDRLNIKNVTNGNQTTVIYNYFHIFKGFRAYIRIWKTVGKLGSKYLLYNCFLGRPPCVNLDIAIFNCNVIVKTERPGLRATARTVCTWDVACGEY